MPIVPVYRIHKASMSLNGLKNLIPKPQIASLTNFCQEGFNEVLARASVTSHQSTMMVVGYSYIFCFSGHVDDLWTTVQKFYTNCYIYIYCRTLIRTLVILMVLNLPVNIYFLQFYYFLLCKVFPICQTLTKYYTLMFHLYVDKYVA